MLPSRETLFPVVLPDGTPHRGTVFLANALRHPNIHVGDFSYYSTFDPLEDVSAYAARLAPYLFEGSADHLYIGKFCQIAQGVRFVTQGANHKMDGISTFPFPIFEADRIGAYSDALSVDRHITIGHDCWLGNSCTILPGATLGNGVIVGAGAVVGGTVPDYAIVVGNPARVLRMRFPQDLIAQVLEAAWWDWSVELIAEHEAAIVGRDVEALLKISKNMKA